MSAAVLTRATIEDATFTVAADRSVTVTAEGATHTIEQVQALAGLGADLPGWAAVALVVHAGARCADLDLDEVFRYAGLDFRARGAHAAAARFHPMMLADRDPSVRSRLAQMVQVGPAPSVQIQVALARDEDFGVRMDLAKAPTTCVEASRLLAEDDEPDILSVLARNTVHAEVLDTALRRVHVEVLRQVLVQRLGVPEPTWDWLAVHPDPRVRTDAAQTGNAPRRVLHRLAGDPEVSVANAAHATLSRLSELGA